MKKVFFLVLAVNFLSAIHTKAKANNIESPVFFDYWHGVLNGTYTDDQKYETMIGAIKNDRNIINQRCTPGIIDPHIIFMTRLTLAAGKDPNNGFISEAEALQMINDGYIGQVTNWWNGQYESGRYASDGMSSSFDPGNPGPNDPHENVTKDEIFFWNKIPLFRWRCLNPIIIKQTVAKVTPHTIPRVNVETEPENNGYQQQQQQREYHAGGGINNSNSVITNVYIPQQQQQQPQPQQVVKSGGGVGTFVVGAVAGFLGAKLLNTNQQVYIPQSNYNYGQGNYFPPTRQVVVIRPPQTYTGGGSTQQQEIYYNTNSLNSQPAYYTGHTY